MTAQQAGASRQDKRGATRQQTERHEIELRGAASNRAFRLLSTNAMSALN
jgi:hypothetical protein